MCGRASGYWKFANYLAVCTSHYYTLVHREVLDTRRGLGAPVADGDAEVLHFQGACSVLHSAHTAACSPWISCDLTCSGEI